MFQPRLGLENSVDKPNSSLLTSMADPADTTRQCCSKNCRFASPDAGRLCLAVVGNRIQRMNSLVVSCKVFVVRFGLSLERKTTQLPLLFRSSRAGKS